MNKQNPDRQLRHEIATSITRHMARCPGQHTVHQSSSGAWHCQCGCVANTWTGMADHLADVTPQGDEAAAQLHTLAAWLDQHVPARWHHGGTPVRIACDMLAAWSDRGRLATELERVRASQVAFSAALGFGDNVTEPAASLADMLEPIAQAMAAARDHEDCPAHCELCGETLAATVCQRCQGSGCGPDSGAHLECEYCGGVGRVHEGCVEASYADLVAERDAAETELARERGELSEIAIRLANAVEHVAGLDRPLTTGRPDQGTNEREALRTLAADAARAGLLPLAATPPAEVANSADASHGLADPADTAGGGSDAR